MQKARHTRALEQEKDLLKSVGEDGGGEFPRE